MKHSVKKNQIAYLITLGSILALSACGGESSANQSKPVTPAAQAPASTTSPATGNQQNITTTITGAGASFPQPIYVQWATAYQQAGKGQLNYQSIGSSGGVKQIIAKTVDFGASDAPMKAEDLAKNDLIQFPTVIGGVVPIINIKGIEAGKLVLNGELLADIYMGRITQWNDPKIAALNPDLKLPAETISTVFRADGSGTTHIFTSYLSQVSPEWQKQVGAANSIKWPTADKGAAGKGNEGVASYVARIPNAIGYVEYAYAKQNNMAHAALKNAAGNVVQPSQQTFAAAAQTDWKKAAGFGVSLTNQADAQAWPIAATTFILMHKKPADPEKVRAALAFFDWAYQNGNDAATKLDYVPLPDATKDLVRQEWKQIVGADGKAIY